jgi:DNA-binding CsgD family transcriptional regulator
MMATHWILLAIAPWSGADLERRRALLERGLAAATEVGEPVSEGFATAYLAHVEVQAGAAAGALERLERCLERLMASGAGYQIGLVEYHAALALVALGRRDEAHAILASVVERDADGLRTVLTFSLSALAAVERRRGDADAARSHAERALEVAGQVGGVSWSAPAQHQLGRLAAERGKWSEAEGTLHQALVSLFEGGHTCEVPDSLEALAEVAAGLESHAEAARLLAAAARARSDLGLVRWTGEDAHWEALERQLRQAIGDDAYEAATAEGSALTMEEAVAYVRRARGSRKRPAGGWESLTPTELEVVRHAATGLTNPEIAERMFISRGTVKVHLSHIYAKLGVRNRGELTAEATRRKAP